MALWIGAQPHTKGLDRVLRAIAGVPQWSLLVAGPDATAVQTLLARAAPSAAARVRALGFCEDVPVLMAAVDVLVHPARLDTTGQVILEALANGLPVIASAACGFAEHVATGGGVVLAEPFAEADLQAAMTDALDQGHREGWSRAALAHVARLDIVNGLDRAADAIASFRPQAPALPD